MASSSSIEWTDATWNPVRGCSRVSEGCRHCYAERQAVRFGGEGMPYAGLVRLGGRHAGWNGKVRLLPEKLDEPLSWRKPRRVFVNSMSDLFHDGVPDEFIADVFGAMALASRHTFQVLTKRPERMQRWLSEHVSERGRLIGYLRPPSGDGSWIAVEGAPWPAPNVWLGVSVENQAAADERIPLLLRSPAAVRFLSCEPLLGPIEFSDVTKRSDAVRQLGKGSLAGIHWVIVGGESGPGARPMHVSWARSIVQQSRATGVAVFIKQLGASPLDRFPDDSETPWPLVLVDRKGGDPEEWPEDLRIREFPQVREGVV